MGFPKGRPRDTVSSTRDLSEMGKGWESSTEKGRKPSDSVSSGTAMQREASARIFMGTLDCKPCLRVVLICDKLVGLSNSHLELLVKGPVGGGLKLTGTSCQQSGCSNQRAILHKVANTKLLKVLHRAHKERCKELIEIASRNWGKALASSSTLGEGQVCHYMHGPDGGLEPCQDEGLKEMPTSWNQPRLSRLMWDGLRGRLSRS